MHTTLQASLLLLALAGCGKDLPPPPTGGGGATSAPDDTASVASPADDTAAGTAEDTDGTTTDDDPETPGDTAPPVDTDGPDDTGSPDDTGGSPTDDTGATGDGECVPSGGDWPVSTGSYTGSVDAAVYNNCENDVGNGYHIHVGSQNPVGMTADDNCLVADFGGMDLAGEVDGEGNVTLSGYLDDAQTSYCTVRIHGTLVGQITDDDTFDYVMEAVAEPLDEDCDLLTGEGETHTFPYLPCDFSWSGRVWKN